MRSYTPLALEPNPVIMSKSGHIHNQGTISLKNQSQQTILFQLSFDGDIFCGISPACGELETGNSRPLKFLLEDTSEKEMNEISFIVKYHIVPKGATPEKVADLMTDQENWTNSITANIKFSSHNEDAMKSISSAFKSRQTSMNKAIARDENRNIDDEQIAMLQRRISEKETQKVQLERKVESLRHQLEKKNEESSKLKRNPQTEYNMVYIGFFVLLLAILKRWLLW